MLKRYSLLPLVICFSLNSFAQTKEDIRPFSPGQTIERDIATGQTHPYRITLAAGQFMRVEVTPQAVNVGLALIAPDGKQVATVNSASFAGPESLSWEAGPAGDYQLTVRAIGAVFNGTYQAKVEVKAA